MEELLSFLPTPVISCANGYRGIVTEAGKLYMWGDNSFGQLPLPNDRVLVPTLCELPWPIRYVDCYNDTTAVITCDGSLYVWGKASPYQRTGTDPYASCTHLPFPEPIVSVAIGYRGMMILTLRGQVYSLGRNSDGFLGLGEIKGVDTFTLVELPLPCLQLKVYSSSSCAIAIDGSLYAWGHNDLGKLGLGASIISYLPSKVYVPEDKGVVSVSIGEDHTSVLTVDGCCYIYGGIEGWHRNSQLHVASPTELKTPAPCKLLICTYNFCIVSTYNEVKAWKLKSGEKVDLKFKGAIQTISVVYDQVWFLSAGKYYHLPHVASDPVQLILSS